MIEILIDGGVMNSHVDGNFKIAILDDDQFWCDGIQKLLEREESLRVIGTVNTQIEAIDIARQYQPDIFLVDINLQSKVYSGITAIIAIHEVSPNTQIIILSSSEDKDDVVTALSVGAVRYILKEQCQLLLPEILKHISGNFNPDKILSEEFARLRQSEIESLLTVQEQELIDALIKGISRSKLADVMYKSESTIKSQIRSILKKLNVKTSEEAILKIKHGGFHSRIKE